MYGAECKQTCQCHHGARCNPETGACHCDAGWIGSLCEHICPGGRYGLNCSRHCVCMNGGTCHHVTGRCHCPPGFTGSLCQTGEYSLLMTYSFLQRAASAVYARAYLSVRLSVRPSHSGIVSKRGNAEGCGLRHWVAQCLLVFWCQEWLMGSWGTTLSR